MTKRTLLATLTALSFFCTPVTAGVLYVKHGVSLNCRSGPSADYPVVKVLHAGQDVKVIKKHYGWAKVHAHHAHCWASVGYLTSHPHKPSYKKKHHGYAKTKVLRGPQIPSQPIMRHFPTVPAAQAPVVIYQYAPRPVYRQTYAPAKNW
jgi:hypothetical protein